MALGHQLSQRAHRRRLCVFGSQNRECTDKHVDWQTVVDGAAVDEHWLRIGQNEYLPILVNGYRIVIPATEAEETSRR